MLIVIFSRGYSPSVSGKIHLISGNPLANACANELFTEYQEVAAKGVFFRRYPLQMVRHKAALFRRSLTIHHSIVVSINRLDIHYID